MAGSPLNEDHELIVHCTAYNYWQAQPDSSRTFNHVKQGGKQFIGQMLVDNFYFAEKEEVIDVNQMTEPLYLFAFAMDESSDSIKITHSQYLLLQWQ